MKQITKLISNQTQFRQSLFFKISLTLACLMSLSMLILGGTLRYGLNSTAIALLKKEVTADSNNISALLRTRVKNAEAAASILAINPDILSSLKNESTDSLMLMDSRAIIIRDRFELDILQIYDSKKITRTNIVQSSLYRVSSLLDVVPPDHADLYLIDDRLVFLSRKDITGGVVITGIDILSELERLAHQLSLRDQITLREGTLSDEPFQYTENAFSLDTSIPVGSKSVVFTITRNTEQSHAIIRTAQELLMVIFSVIAFLLALMTIYVVRNITNPIQSLSNAARELANADFSSPFQSRAFFEKRHNPFRIGFGDEIGQLAETFTFMEKELHAVYSGLINDLQKANTDLNNAYDATLVGWSSALELRDHETEKHTNRVIKHVEEFARYMGLTEPEIVNIRRGAYLHDVGKMAIPDHILKKTGRLSEEEWGIMRQHPLYGYIMLRPIEYLKDVLDIPYCHHEKWDGSGYPRGLQGTTIPLAARIFSIVDVWDALTSDRPYRSAWSQEKALAYIHDGAGNEFDPKIVEKFFEWLKAQKNETVHEVQ